MTALQYMEFSLFGHPFELRWPRQATILNPLAITEQITPENAEAYILAKCAGVSRNIVELGTQYGLFSNIMAQALPADGKLVGLEILPANVQISNENLRVNGLAEKAVILHAAAFATDGYDTAAIDIHRENASLLGVAGPTHGIGTMDVPRMSLRRLQSFFGPFDMMKIDVEGFEGTFVEASQEDLARIAIVAMEIHPHLMHHNFGRTVDSLMKHFPQGQYTGFLLVGSDGRYAIRDLHDENTIRESITSNAFFFKRESHAALAAFLRNKMEEMDTVQPATAAA